MQVTLSPEMDAIVQREVSSGHYASADEVVEDALRMFDAWEFEDDADSDSLRKEIQIGIDEADQGLLVDGEEMFAKLRERNRQWPRKAV